MLGELVHSFHMKCHFIHKRYIASDTINKANINCEKETQ